MNKNRKIFSNFPNLSNVALCTTIIAILGIGALVMSPCIIRKNARHKIAHINNQIRKNDSALCAYMIHADQFQENTQMKKTLDSLNNHNIQMFYDAQDKYTTRIDKKYPMGHFMDANQIAQLNRTVMPYVYKLKKSDKDAYALARMHTPFTARSGLSEFQYVLHLTDIPAEKLAPLDMIVHEGFLYFFNDAHQQKLYESYLEELSHAYSDFNENEPNFDIQENAVIRDEYMKNKGKIAELNNEIMGNNFLISQTIANFQRKHDSLNILREKYQAKLK